MCLAIFKPAGLTIPQRNLQAGFYGNCSGSGFMYHHGGKLTVVKGLFSFEEFYEQYHKIEKAHDVAVHFRAATHGPVNDANCHPFVMCDGNFAMIHNGIFQVPMRDQQLSDTGNYCKIILEPAIKSGDYKNTKKYVDDITWGWGAVVLMSADGEITFFNEKMGDWNKGVWYSNNGYQYGDSDHFRKYAAERNKQGFRPTPREAYIRMFYGDED